MDKPDCEPGLKPGWFLNAGSKEAEVSRLELVEGGFLSPALIKARAGLSGGRSGLLTLPGEALQGGNTQQTQDLFQKSLVTLSHCHGDGPKLPLQRAIEEGS